MENDPTNQITWRGTVREIKKNWIVVNYDVGPTDPTEAFDLPYQKPGIVYYEIGPDTDDKSSGDMLAFARQRISLLQITAWRPLTWGHLLHPASGDKLLSKAQLMGELRAFFFLKTSHSLTQASDTTEHELATADETLNAWISLAQATSDWKQQPFLNLIEPTLIRLCALRRASPFTDHKRRAEAIFSVHKAYQTSTPSRDRLTELMMEPLSKGN